jgi:FkbM family methyltransferase
MTATVEGLRRVGRKVLPFPAFRALSECYTFVVGVGCLGFREYRSLRSLAPDKSAKVLSESVEFRIPSLDRPIFVRPGTTDAGSVIHTALRNGYGKYLPDEPVRLIIDAGANIGDTTAWYLSRFPQARVFALEPDSENYKMLQRNCAPYGRRAELMKCGLWSSTAYLKVAGDRHMESGLFVTETLSEVDADCMGISPLDLLIRSGESHIDIFKCDIEGAECEVFRRGYDEWLSRTRSIFIEIHSSEAYGIVIAATRRHGFSCRVYRDLHIFHKF